MWAVLTPKNVSSTSDVQKIVVASVYSKPDSRKKTVLLDHISQVYNLLCSKYKRGLHWIIAGDTNDLRLDPILMMSPNLKQVVQNFTRLNPPRLLDPIITTLSRFYQVPQVLPPLDSDPDCNGKPSDHMMVVMTPITGINSRPESKTKNITFKPISEQGLQKMKEWLENESWAEITGEPCANKKAEVLQRLLMRKYDEYFPEKCRKISILDQPFFTHKLSNLKRKKGREYNKHCRSNKWKYLEEIYQKEISAAKKGFYRKRIKMLRKSKP